MHQPLKFMKLTLALLAFLTVAFAPPAGAAPTEKRMALVIGNGAYQSGALANPANDAGLIAQTLQAAGFDVVGARDLDEDSLRHAFRDFVDNASKAGPETVVAVYFAGYGLQLEGENYLVPVDANISRDADVPVRSLRLSDYTRALAALRLKATIVVLDAARANPFSMAGQRLAGGLALMDPEPGMLIAFNAAPGTIAPEGQDGYGPYAKALAEMIREGGLPPADVFDRVRLRVNEMTRGAQVPWDASKIQAQFVFFERGPGAPPSLASAEQTASIRSRPIRDLGAPDAYLAALSRDTLNGYEDFLNAYPRDPMAKRVRAIVAARREAITWRRTYQVDSPEGYWSYLRRYPRGPHVADARRRLVYLAAAYDPPPRFAMIEYDVPPPPPDEVVYYERPVLIFDDPIFAFAPPPPPPVYFLAPPPPEFIVLEPPPRVYGAYILPVPVFIPVPVYVSPPVYVAPPPNPIIFNNIHNTVVVNNTTNVVTITNPSGQVVAAAPAVSGGGAASAPTLTPALPPAVVQKAALIDSKNPPATPGANPAAKGQGTPADTGKNLLTTTAPANTPADAGKNSLTTTAPSNTPAGAGKNSLTTTAPANTPADTGKNSLTTTAPTNTPAGAGKNSLTTTAPANTPADTGKNSLTTTAPTNTPAGAGKNSLTTTAPSNTPADAGKNSLTTTAPTNTPSGTGKNSLTTTAPTNTPSGTGKNSLTTTAPTNTPAGTGKNSLTTTAPANTPADTGKNSLTTTAPTNTPAGAGKNSLTTTAPANTPADARKNSLTTTAPANTPADAGRKSLTTTAPANAPADTGKKPLANTTSAPISAPVQPVAPTPPVVHQAAPPVIVHQAPPPDVVHQAPPPPPPQPAVRQVQTPPPPPAPPPPPPPPPAANTTPVPAAAAAAAAAKPKCPVVNGKEACPK